MRSPLARASVALLVATSASGCGGGGETPDAGDAGRLDVGSPPLDAGLAIEAPAAPAPPAEVNAPELPRITPCPDGWSARELGDVTACAPWPGDADPTACAADESLLPGSDTCARIGAACPSGDFATDLPDADVVYVRAGAGGGDGSRSAPFGTISEALAVATSGTVVALSRGTFDERVEIPAGVTLRGACVAETTIAPSGFEDDAYAITVSGAGAALDSLTVSGDLGGVRVSGDGSSLQMQGVAISGIARLAVSVPAGTTLTGRDVILRDLRGRPSDDRFGRGVQSGGTVELTDAVIERARSVAVSADGGRVRLTAVAIRDVRADASETPLGIGVFADGGAEVELARSVIEQARGSAVLAGSMGTDVTIRRSVVRATEPLSPLLTGRGVSVESQATLSLERVLLEDHHEAAVFANAATLSARDVVVRSTSPSPETDGETGRAVSTQRGASLTGRRLWVEDSTEVAFLVGPRVEADVTDLVVRGTRERSDGLAGRGLEVAFQTMLTLERATFEDNHETALIVLGGESTLRDITVRGTRQPWAAETMEGHEPVGITVQGVAQLERALVEDNELVGLAVLGPDADLTATDVVVRDVVPRDADGFGRGIEVGAGARANLQRVSVKRHADIGVFVRGAATTTTLRDVRVSDGRGNGVDGSFGRGLAVQGALVAERVEIVDNRDLGVGITGEGSVAEIDDLVVRGTGSIPSGIFGRGLNVQFGASATVRRAVLEENREVSVFVLDAELDLSDAVVAPTLPRDCPADDAMCAEAGAGHGLGGYGRAEVTVERFRIAHSEIAGVQITDEAVVRLSQGVVRDNLIGVNLQVPGYDVSQLQNDVRYVNNERALDAEELPVPGAAL